MKTFKRNAFTLVELLVVILIIAIVVVIGIPAFTAKAVRGRGTQALSNVKQIVLVCKLFAMDHNGDFPTNQLDPTSLEPSKTLGPITDYSNTAFAQLFPDYLTNETVFAEQGSAFTPTPPDNVIDVPQVAPPMQTLKENENTFAYCIGLTEKSNALFPLVADGFANLGQWQYSTDKTVKGGVWEGSKAVVGLVDGSASMMKVNGRRLTVMNNPVSSSSSYFSTAGVASKDGQQWLTSPRNYWLNPR
jgi:prepilin-type N-terminal cleavage/methylation domain-containing protein